MDRDELRDKITEVLTIEDQSERSTVLNDMRSEIEKTFEVVDKLREENQSLKEKNESLTQANSKLFMQIGYEKSNDEKKNVNVIDLKKLGI